MGTSSYSMADIASLTQAVSTPSASKSTSRKGNTELEMQDFLQLMIVQLQNQTIDDTMDTSEMMNQMVQMQMITAITNMNETSIMTYASSLVGKVVTIGIVNGNSLEEREVEVIGTGVSNGQQVIFGKDGKGNVETYALNQIMAVGRLPDIQEAQGIVDKTEGGDGEETGEVEGTEGAVTEQPETTDKTPEYDGTQGAPADDT
ncbi:MAG: hypothetical protein HDT38_07665 [Clostridiales bacterium]|nr:hypothetical protein [Clostridiales bacterium]